MAGGIDVSTRTWIVVPCYNEAARFDVTAFEHFLNSDAAAGIHFLLVDDGSRDQTGKLLESLAKRWPGRVEALPLQRNGGKAEAVRQGVSYTLRYDPGFFGYWDADWATPLESIPEFIDTLTERDELNLVLGARVRLLGRSVERRLVRHLLGRVFATAASLTLGLPVYDTQCGAKLFRNTPEMRALFATPFETGWTFDVELLARLLTAAGPTSKAERVAQIVEHPLRQWRDVAGSKVKPRDFFVSFVGLSRIAWTYFGPGRKSQIIEPTGTATVPIVQTTPRQRRAA